MRTASRIRKVPSASELAVYSGAEAHGHMALSTKVVDLIRHHLLDDSNQVGAVGEVAVVKDKAGIALVRILI